MKPTTLLLLLSLCWHMAPAQNLLTGRTTGALPYLNYGLGEDRLGGAKMTYADTGILVRVVDSNGTDYRIKLSAAHDAWLPKSNFRMDTSVRVKPYYLSSSWRVWGDERYDYVSVGLTEKLPYRSIQQIDPARIVVDIFGVTSNTNWITQLKTVKEIKNVWYEQVEDDVFRVYIELRHQHWGYLVHYVNHNLQIRVKRTPVSHRHKDILIAIDPGHGGTNEGATGITSNVKEKEYTLRIATQVAHYLRKKHFQVFMTRTEDKELSMPERTLMLREQDPNLLVSIHLNSSGNPSVKGVSTYYRYIGFRPLSQAILNRMLQLGLDNYGNVGAFNFSLSGPTEYPNCLVEVAFLSNTEDEHRILDPRFHKAVAKKIYKGICDWLRGR